MSAPIPFRRLLRHHIAPHPTLPRERRVANLQHLKASYPEKNFGPEDGPYLTVDKTGFWPDLEGWIIGHPHVEPVALVESLEEWRARLQLGDGDVQIMEELWSRSRRMYYEEKLKRGSTFDEPYNQNRYSGIGFVMDPSGDDPTRFWYDCYLDSAANQGDEPREGSDGYSSERSFMDRESTDDDASVGSASRTSASQGDSSDQSFVPREDGVGGSRGANGGDNGGDENGETIGNRVSRRNQERREPIVLSSDEGSD